jgi:hypothetical protein
MTAIPRSRPSGIYAGLTRIGKSPACPKTRFCSATSLHNGEAGLYAKAIQIAGHSYALRIRTNEPDGVAANMALKLAVFNFYMGDPPASRRWLDAVPQPNWAAEYQRFNQRVARCERIRKALYSPVPAEQDLSRIDSRIEDCRSRADIPGLVTALRSTIWRASGLIRR